MHSNATWNEFLTQKDHFATNLRYLVWIHEGLQTQKSIGTLSCAKIQIYVMSQMHNDNLSVVHLLTFSNSIMCQTDISYLPVIFAGLSYCICTKTIELPWQHKQLHHLPCHLLFQYRTLFCLSVLSPTLMINRLWPQKHNSLYILLTFDYLPGSGFNQYRDPTYLGFILHSEMLPNN